MELQSLCVPEGKGLQTEVVDDQGNKTHKVFSHLDVPFGDPRNYLPVAGLPIGQRFTWKNFDAVNQRMNNYILVVSNKKAKPDKGLPWVVQIDITNGNGAHTTEYFDKQSALLRQIFGGFDLWLARRQLLSPNGTQTLSD